MSSPCEPRRGRGGALAVAIVAAVIGQVVPEAAASQGLASLRVVVTDQTGGIVSGARVVVMPAQEAGFRSPAGRLASDRRGEAWFGGLPPGLYTVTTEAPGFEPRRIEAVRLHEGENLVRVRLELARIREEVTVRRQGRDAALDLRAGTFATVLGPDEVGQLPSDPDDMRAVLEQLGGPGAVIRVNGFRGGRLPPASQIREIRIRRDPLAAEHHEAGIVAIEVATRPGGVSPGGAVEVAAKDAALAARHSAAGRSGIEHRHRASVEAGGPLERGRSSFAVAIDATRARDRAWVDAVLPGAATAGSVSQPSVQARAMVRFEREAGGSGTLRLEWQGVRSWSENQGVGGIAMPERAVSRATGQQWVRLFLGGAIGQSGYHESRVQARWESTRVVPRSDAPALIVPGALAAGGAQVAGWRRDRIVELVEDIDLVRGKHALRFGGHVEVVRHASDESVNAGGTFTFTGPEAYATGRPHLFVRRTGDAAVRFSHAQAAWYAQDEWRAREGMSIALGVRGEAQSRVAGRIHAAPRAAIAWSPVRGGTTTVRGGVGLFNGWVGTSVWEQVLRVDGARQRDLVVVDPGFPAPGLTGSTVVLPAGRYEIDPDVRLPRTVRLVVGIERQVSPAFRVAVSCAEERGWWQLRGRDTNAPEPGRGRPVPRFGTVTRVESRGRALSHAVDVTVFLAPPAWRLMVAATYRWSRTFNESDDPFSLPANSLDPAAEWGPAASDFKHRVAAFLSVRPRDTLRMGLNVVAASAAPYTVTTGRDDNGDTVINDRLPGASRHGARGAALVEASARLTWSLPLGRHRAPALPAGGRDGGAARTPPADEGRGSDTTNGPSRRWPSRFEVYVSGQNLLNRSNAVAFCGVLTSPRFGEALTLLPPRRIEIGARVGF